MEELTKKEKEEIEEKEAIHPLEIIGTEKILEMKCEAKITEKGIEIRCLEPLSPELMPMILEEKRPITAKVSFRVVDIFMGEKVEKAIKKGIYGIDGINEREYGSQLGGRELTFVFPDECVSNECKLIVHYPQIVRREKGQKMYLGFQSEDVPPEGLSHITEVKDVAEQILQDVDTQTISKLKGRSRLRGLKLGVIRTTKGELAEEPNKEKAYNILDEDFAKIIR